MAGGGAEGGGGSHLECIKQNNTSQHLSSPGRTLGPGTGVERAGPAVSSNPAGVVQDERRGA